MLQTGDPCPCCGMPIRSTDPAVLRMLTLIAEGRYLPTMDEIRALYRDGAGDNGG